MSKETLPSYLPDDYEHIKETQDDGTTVFRHPLGSPIRTYETNLTCFMHTWLSKFQSLVDLLSEKDCGSFGCIFESLIQSAKIEFDEVRITLERSIGTIKLESIGRGDNCYRTGRVVGVSVKDGKGVAS